MRSSSNRRRIPIASVALAAALAGAACAKTDDRPAVWTYISAELFQPNCATASCHSRGRAVAGLDFSDPGRGYKSLTGLKVWIPDPDGTLGGNCLTVDGTVYCERDRPLVVAFDSVAVAARQHAARARRAAHAAGSTAAGGGHRAGRSLDSRRRAGDARWSAGGTDAPDASAGDGADGR